VILYGNDSVEYYIEYILFNPVASTIPEWRSVKFLRWSQILNRLVDLDEVLYGTEGIEYYLGYILFNLVALTIPK
jgi:hypothetical protein